MRRLFSRSALGAIGIALTVAGCGASHQSSGPKPSNTAAPQIRRAADISVAAPGYKVAGSGTFTEASQSSTMTMSGSFNRQARVGSIVANVNAAGQHVQIKELLSGYTLYMATGALPQLAEETGKPWIELNISGAIPGNGLSSISSGDPVQYINYLKAVSSSTKDLGTVEVRGVPTTHYHVVVDLSRYPSLVPPQQRKGAQLTIKTLETALGSDSMPIDVWIDHHNLIRRESYGYTECVSGQKFSGKTTLDIYDYGPQPKPRLPSASEAYNLTPRVLAILKHAKLGCSS